MRIALLCPPWIPVPPSGYGGIEWVVSLLVEELIARGHEVTLFASNGSRTKAELISVFDEAPTTEMHRNIPDARHAARAFREVLARAGTPGEFDVLHDHSACIALAAAPALPLPVVHTLHGAFTHEMREFYAGVAVGVTFVAISDVQRNDMPALPVSAIVPNSVDVESFPFTSEKGDYLLCLGRITRDKGQDTAIAVAKRTGTPLVLAGKIDPGADQQFFEDAILPHIDGQLIRFEGEVPDERKKELLAGARAALFPIRWQEPFGLVMIEAMSCGTPVIANGRGAVPEVVTDGVTGFITQDEDGMVAALSRLDAIDSKLCRADALARFSPAGMADGYERVYAEAVAAFKRG